MHRGYFRAAMAVLIVSALNGGKNFKEIFSMNAFEGVPLLGRLISREHFQFITEFFCMAPREGQPSRASPDYHPTQLIQESTNYLTQISKANWNTGERNMNDLSAYTFLL